MKRVLVTGATGNVGRHVVAQLLGADCHVRVLTHTAEVSGFPPQVELVRGDLTDAGSLDACLDDVDTVFLVWTGPVAAAPAAVGRIARHTERIVLLTAPLKTHHPFFQQPNPLRELFTELEDLIEASGLGWTFLRAGMFADNALAWWAPQIRAGNEVRWPHAAAPTAPIDVRDIAAVAVCAVLDARHNGAEYVLTGPESLSQQEQVLTIGKVIGRPLHFAELTPDEARRQLGFPEPAMTMLLDAWEAAIGQPAFISPAAAEVTGNRTRTFHQWATDHALEFHA